VVVLGVAGSAGTHHAGQEQALAAVGRRATSVIAHFDVDAVDSRNLPLANDHHYGTGVALADAARVLTVLCAAPRLAAIVLTEVNSSMTPRAASWPAMSTPSPPRSPTA
jgi:hypothetical protein